MVVGGANGRKPYNQRKPYTDAQIRDILSVAPTRANAELKAAAYGRTVNAIRHVWWYAGASKKEIREYEERYTKGERHPYVRQILRVRKSVGWLMLRGRRRGSSQVRHSIEGHQEG